MAWIVQLITAVSLTHHLGSMHSYQPPLLMILKYVCAVIRIQLMRISLFSFWSCMCHTKLHQVKHQVWYPRQLGLINIVITHSYKPYYGAQQILYHLICKCSQCSTPNMVSYFICNHVVHQKIIVCNNFVTITSG